MLSARLEAMGHQVLLGLIKEIRLVGAILYVDGTETARFSEGTWDRGTLCATAIPIESEAQLRFEGSDGLQVDCGPFSSLRVTGGVIHADQRSLAMLDELSGKWRLKHDGSDWESVSIRRPHHFE